jgi:hypothetical protein
MALSHSPAYPFGVVRWVSPCFVMFQQMIIECADIVIEGEG